MSTTLDITAELEAIASRLTDEQLEHIGATWTARAVERRRQAVSEGWNTSPDPETEAAFAELEPLADRLLRRAQRSRSHGIDDDLIGCAVASELFKLGYGQEEAALMVAEAGIAWRPRTADERLVAAATELLQSGLDEQTVQDALATLAVSQ